MRGFSVMDESHRQQYQHLLYPRRSSGQIAGPSQLFPPGQHDNSGLQKAVVAPSPSSIPTPFGMKGGGPKTGLAAKSDRARGDVVELSGLPKPLMSRAMLETLVEQSELAKNVRIVDIRFAHGKAFVTFANLDDATAFIEHCDGRPWNPKGPPISATLQAPTKGMKKAQPPELPPKPSKGGTATISKKTAAQMAAQQEEAELSNSFAWDSFEQVQRQTYRPTNSEASTAVGDSDGEERLGFHLLANSLKFGVHLSL